MGVNIRFQNKSMAMKFLFQFEAFFHLFFFVLFPPQMTEISKRDRARLDTTFTKWLNIQSLFFKVIPQNYFYLI